MNYRIISLTSSILLNIFLFYSFSTTNAATIPLSHNQYMVTYTGAGLDEIVGVFDPWYPTDDTTTATFTYALVDNENDLYTINSVDGTISIKENSGLKPGIDTLVVRIQLKSLTEKYYVYVKVKALSECVFIDPSSSASGNGTKSAPYSSWSQVNFVPGKAYLQKRGTVSNKPIEIRLSGASGKEIIVAAYGSGSRPRVATDLLTSGAIVAGDYIQFYEFHFSGNSTGIRTASGSEKPVQYCVFSDLTFSGNQDNGQLYFLKHGDVGENELYHQVYDILAYNGSTYGLKYEGGNIITENVRTYGNVSGISVPVWGDHNIIKGLSSYDNKGYGLEISGCAHDVSFCYFKDNYINLVVDDPESSGSIIHHSLFDRGTGDASIKLRSNGIHWKTNEIVSSGRNVTIEYNTIRNNTENSGISIEYSMKHIKIFRNLIYNNLYGIFIGKNEEKVDTVMIYYNVLYGNLRHDIYGYQGNYIRVFNNTVDGSICFFASTENIVRNNFYKTITGKYTASNNIRIGSISTSSYFLNYPKHDYRLRPQALLAIDEGYSLSLSPDFLNVSVPKGDGPEIGAFEYIPGAVESVPNAPSALVTDNFADKSITISWKDNSSNESSFYIKRTTASNLKEIVIIEVPANNTVFTDKELKPGSTFIYTVQAVNNAGSSGKSNSIIASTFSLAENLRVKEGLIAYYNYNYDPYNFVRDLSGYDNQLDLKILNPSSTSWNEKSKLSVNSSTALVSTASAEKVINAIKKTNAFTVEMWLTPFEPNSTSSSRILSIGANDVDEGIAIEQYYDSFGDKKLNFGVRLRTETTNNTGFPELKSDNFDTYLTMQHLVYEKDSVGNEKLYINGSKKAEGYRPGNMQSWSNNFYFRLVNEASLENPWKGALYLTAIYNRPLSEKEIKKNYDLGPSDSISNKGMTYQINVFPNPCKDIARIEITPQENLNYLPATYFCIKDMMGRTCFVERIFNPSAVFTKEIDVTNFASGMYFVQMISNKQQSNVKLLVE